MPPKYHFLNLNCFWWCPSLYADNRGILDAQLLKEGSFHPVLAACGVAFCGWKGASRLRCRGVKRKRIPLGPRALAGSAGRGPRWEIHGGWRLCFSKPPPCLRSGSAPSIAHTALFHVCEISPLYLKDHRITERLKLEGTLKHHQVPLPRLQFLCKLQIYLQS